MLNKALVVKVANANAVNVLKAKKVIMGIIMIAQFGEMLKANQIS
jgi:hypothetical protein